MQAGAQDCDDNKQFDEKRCRLLLNLDNIPACDGAVALHYAWGKPPREAVCDAAQGNLVLWSIGAPKALPVRLLQGCRRQPPMSACRHSWHVVVSRAPARLAGANGTCAQP